MRIYRWFFHMSLLLLLIPWNLTAQMRFDPAASTLFLTVYDSVGTLIRNGLGVAVVDAHHVLTAADLLRDGARVTIRTTKDGRGVDVSVVDYIDWQSGVALLRLPSDVGASVAAISEDIPAARESVFYVAQVSPSGIAIRGTVLDRQVQFGPLSIVFLSPRPEGVSLGAPVFLSNGTLLGIDGFRLDTPVVGQIEMIPALNYAPFLQAGTSMIPLKNSASIFPYMEIRRAVTNHILGKAPEAIRILSDIISRYPVYIPARLFLAYMVWEDPRRAAQILNEIPLGFTDPFMLHFNLGVALYHLRDFEASRIEIEKAQAFAEGASQAEYFRGLLALAAGDSAEGMRLLRSSAERKDATLPSLVNWGSLLFQREDYSSAFNIFTQAAKLSPRNRQALLGLGASQFALRDYKAAYGSFQLVLKDSPQDPDASLGLGLVSQALGEFSNASAALRVYLKAHRDEPRAHEILGNVLLQAGDYKGAIDAYKEAIRLDPSLGSELASQNASLVESTARTLALKAFEKIIVPMPEYVGLTAQVQKLGNLELARQLQEVAFHLPLIAQACYARGMLQATSGQSNDALNSFRAAIEFAPAFGAAYQQLGIIQLATGRISDAVATYKKSVEVEPANADAYYGLGLSYIQEKDYNNAIAALNNALRLRPSFGEAYYALGSAYLSLNNHRAAVDALKSAIKYLPTSPRAHFALGESYVQLGDRTNALAEYEQLKKLDPDLAAQLLSEIYK
ncbi:MAG: tetratricopeptide repeat protein [Bacteroidota bacterium]